MHHDVPSNQPSPDSLGTKVNQTTRAKTSGQQPCWGYEVNSQCSKVMIVSMHRLSLDWKERVHLNTSATGGLTPRLNAKERHDDEELSGSRSKSAHAQDHHEHPITQHNMLTSSSTPALVKDSVSTSVQYDVEDTG